MSEIEQVCIEEAYKCFTQEYDTSLLQEPFFLSAGAFVFGPANIYIINQTFFTPEGIYEQLYHLLNELFWTSGIPPTSTVINTEQFYQGWKKTKEITYGGPFFIYF